MSASLVVSDRATAYRHAVGDVLAALATDGERGLAQAEARARLAQYGPNELSAEKPIPGWRKFLAQFRDVLVILLLIATAISAGLWLYERDTALPYEAMAIFAVVLLNAVMGYVQQSRAEQAVAALQRMSAADAQVVRDDARHTVPARELVPGDIILVEEGDTIPADARLIDATALQTAEAALAVGGEGCQHVAGRLAVGGRVLGSRRGSSAHGRGTPVHHDDDGAAVSAACRRRRAPGRRRRRSRCREACGRAPRRRCRSRGDPRVCGGRPRGCAVPGW